MNENIDLPFPLDRILYRTTTPPTAYFRGATEYTIVRYQFGGLALWGRFDHEWRIVDYDSFLLHWFVWEQKKLENDGK